MKIPSIYPLISMMFQRFGQIEGENKEDGDEELVYKDRALPLEENQIPSTPLSQNSSIDHISARSIKTKCVSSSLLP